MGTAATQLDEETLIRQKIAAIRLPEGVKFKRVEQMHDWTGDPSLRIYLSVSKRRPIDPKSIRELTRITGKIQEDILSLGLGKFPYVRLVESR